MLLQEIASSRHWYVMILTDALLPCAMSAPLFCAVCLTVPLCCACAPIAAPIAAPFAGGGTVGTGAANGARISPAPCWLAAACLAYELGRNAEASEAGPLQRPHPLFPSTRENVTTAFGRSV